MSAKATFDAVVPARASAAVEASWHGATLAERLAHVRRGGPAARTELRLDEAVLAPWARASAFGHVEAFRRRLSWDGIDPAAAAAAMAVEAPADFPVHPWVARLPELAAEARQLAASMGAPGEPELPADLAASLPFAAAWLPVVRSARRRLAAAAPRCDEWLSRPAVGALEGQLLRELSRVGELTLLEDYRAQSEGHDAYLRSLLASRYTDLLTAWPVLARQAVLLADQWVAQSAALVARLRDDRPHIESAFGRAAGPAERIVPGLSDRHAGGGRVAMIEFASGLRLAYKPRDVRLERAFNDLLRWLQVAGLDAAPRALRVVDRGTHGWIEWVEQEPLDSAAAVPKYFRAAGTLICLAHVLGATDLHSENLVATASGPVLVDVEMLLQPSTRPATGSIGEATPDADDPAAASDSCLASGLVRHLVVDRSGKAFDVGGLQPAAPRAPSVAMRRWLDVGRDDIRFVAEEQVYPVLRNDAVHTGVVQRPEDFAGDLCAGFEAAWRILERDRAALLDDQGPLAAFAGCLTRVLFRASDQYAAVQYLLAAPRYHRLGLDRSLALETFGRVFAREAERPRLWPLVHDERAALEQLDIPRQTLRADAVDLEAASGEVVRGFYARSGFAAMTDRLAARSAAWLGDQLDQLGTALRSSQSGVARPQRAPRAAVSSPRAVRPALGAPAGTRAGGGSPLRADHRYTRPPSVRSVRLQPDPESAVARPQRAPRAAGLVAAAERIGHEVLARAHDGPDGGLRWVSCAGREDLYAGASGIGLFLAALAAATADEGWRDAARRALAGAAHPPGLASGRLGACNGPHSVAYALALAGRLLGDEEMAGRGRTLAASVPPGAIDGDGLFDIEGGAAGALAALLAIHEMQPDDRLLAAAERCVLRLVAAQIQNGADRGAWPAGEDQRARPGFAHGAAGIAYALCRWTPHASDGAVTRAIGEAWDFERRLFAASHETWPATRRDGGRVVMAAWCHGAPGVALARALTPSALADDRVRGEIEAAMRQTLAAPASPLDHLCCGNLGRADVALTVGLRTKTPAWSGAGTTMAEAVAARVAEAGRSAMRGRGFQFGAPAPELFQGLAGIGYQLLRAASPSTVPSVLAFEGVSPGEDRDGA